MMSRRKKQLTIFRCSICQEQLNNYKRARAINITTQTKGGGFKSEIACRSCIKKHFLQCTGCGKIILDLRPYLQGEILTCDVCKISKPKDFTSQNNPDPVTDPDYEPIGPGTMTILQKSDKQEKEKSWNDWDQKRKHLKEEIKKLRKKKQSTDLPVNQEKCYTD